MMDYVYINFYTQKKWKGKKKNITWGKRGWKLCYSWWFWEYKIAYSIGIRDIIQFDKALADKGIDIYIYDHTFDKLPYENNKFHWKKKELEEFQKIG